LGCVVNIKRFITNADSVYTTNATQSSIGLSASIAANERQHVRLWIPITTGAAGGVRLQVVVPAGGAFFELKGILYLSTGSFSLFNQQTSAVYTNAIASAGSHYFDIELGLTNGATAGQVDIQMAQNTSNALSLTVLQGSYMENVII